MFVNKSNYRAVMSEHQFRHYCDKWRVETLAVRGALPFAECIAVMSEYPPGMITLASLELYPGNFLIKPVIELPPAQTPAIVVPFRKPLPAPARSDRRRGVWPGTYEEYLATPEWAAIAAAARKEWNYRCMINTSHRGYVEVHHREYRGVPFGEDLRWDLTLLCEECHALYHDKLPRPPVGLFDEIIRPLKVAA